MVEGPSLLTMCRLQGRAAGGDGQAFFFFSISFSKLFGHLGALYVVLPKDI